MGLEIEMVMDYWRRDVSLREQFTRLEDIVYPIVKLKDDEAEPVLQIFEIYGVHNVQTKTEQFRLILSDGEEFQEAVLAPELIENAKRNLITKGSIIRILEYTLHASVYHELKRIIKVIRVEVLVANFRLIGNPIGLNRKEWKEEDWEEDTWVWLDPEEQEYEEVAYLDEPCSFRDLSETITPGAVAAINTNRNVELGAIILQIVDIRLIIDNVQSVTEKFRMVLSDGTHLLQAMLATQLNGKVKNNKAVNGSILFLLEYTCETVQNRRFIIVLDMTVLKIDAEIVGNPIEFSSDSLQGDAGL